MGARSSPGAGETIHGPVAHPGAGALCCQTPRVTTRPRAAGAVLCLFLAGPLVLAGCGKAERSGTSGSSASVSVSESEPSKGAAAEPTATASQASETDSDAGFPADTEADTEADTADAAPDTRVTVRDIRIGGHDGLDRVVFDVGGTGTPGWDVRYVDAATSQGTGDPLDVAGEFVLQVTLTGAGYPYDTGVEEYAGGPLTSASTSVVEEVAWDATYEGTSVAFVGTAARHPFRVYALADPTRVVVDIAHDAG